MKEGLNTGEEGFFFLLLLFKAAQTIQGRKNRYATIPTEAEKSPFVPIKSWIQMGSLRSDLSPSPAGKSLILVIPSSPAAAEGVLLFVPAPFFCPCTCAPNLFCSQPPGGWRLSCTPKRSQSAARSGVYSEGRFAKTGH